MAENWKKEPTTYKQYLRNLKSFHYKMEIFTNFKKETK